MIRTNLVATREKNDGVSEQDRKKKRFYNLRDLGVHNNSMLKELIRQ